MAVMDFKEAICTLIKDPVTQVVPDPCKKSFASQAAPALAILVGAMALLVIA